MRLDVDKINLLLQGVLHEVLLEKGKRKEASTNRFT